MASKITQEDIININELYLKYKTYAEVARQTGFSPSTVKKYVVSNFVSQDKLEIKKFDKLIPDTFPADFPKNINEWAAVLATTSQEITNMEKLRKEILI